MDIKKPQLGKVEAFAFVFQREFCNTICICCREFGSLN